MIIRKMSEQDLNAVSIIEHSIFSRPWSRDDFANAIQNKDNIYLVAEEHNEIIGYCGLWGVAGEGQINNVAVAMKYRDKHVGTILLEELLDKGFQGGLGEFFLEVRESNGAAIHLYKKLGFKEIGIRKNFYEAPREHAVLMCKNGM